MRAQTLPQPAPPPARAAEMTANGHLACAARLSVAADSVGLTDHNMAACLAGLDACYHGMSANGPPNERDDTLSRACRLYREALKRAVARRGPGVVVAVGPVRLRIDGHGDLEIKPEAGNIRGPFTMEVGR